MYDVFISHASEDKEEIVREIAIRLSDAGLKVWYDEFTLKLGDSLRQSIEMGMNQSTFGIVILSPSFFQKSWPQSELNGLFAIEMTGKKVIIPVWHNIDFEEIATFSPIIADRVAVKTSQGIDNVVKKILNSIKNTSVENKKKDSKRYHVDYSFNWKRKINPQEHKELSLSPEHLNLLKIVFQETNGAISPAAKVLKLAGFQRNASESRLREILGLNRLKSFLNTDDIRNLRNWYSSVFPNKNSRLRMFEGVWKSDSGATCCARIIKGKLVIPYCYSGNFKLSAHYYDCVLKDDKLFARFQWFDQPTSGLAFYEILSENEISGGWWFNKDIPKAVANDLTLLKPGIPGMKLSKWKRKKRKKYPLWAEEYFIRLLTENEI